MEQQAYSGKVIEEWIQDFPLITQLQKLKEISWFNDEQLPFTKVSQTLPFGVKDVVEAEQRLDRFRPYIARVFPETRSSDGLIESPLQAVPEMKSAMEEYYQTDLPGCLYAKCDSHLPISGSIKARGGIYEVLKHAETLAFGAGMLSPEDDYALLDSEEFRQFFKNYSIAVGSTGNLGMSIGIISAQIGFQVTVHMSSDARQWKKDLLRSRGVIVKEYSADYSIAVAEGRAQAAGNANCYFIDDENSLDLFMGYAVAAGRLKKQLDEQSVSVDEDHPLFVYLPCGVGGAPGGVAFGLKTIFGDNVHCILAEPVNSPSMLLGLYTGQHDSISVQDVGIDNATAADGLAVGRPSGFVGRHMQPLLDGVYTVNDAHLFKLLSMLQDSEGLKMEPSALAGFPGMVKVLQPYSDLNKSMQGLNIQNATHIAWCTGGSMVPEEIMAGYYQQGVAQVC